jgi:hypothetical protein
MFPKRNLTNLPDPKIIKYIRILNEYGAECESE